MIEKATIAEWRSEQGSGSQSALGEYTPPEFWELLDAYELQLKRILALEEALAVAHEAAIKADRKERGRIGNVSGNELYAMFSNAPVEPHPLLAQKELK